MTFETKNVERLTYGINLRAFTGSTSRTFSGEAQDAMDMLPRDDGAVYQTFGWRRINDTALTGVPIACGGFTYRGKNVDPSGSNTARGGVFALADDGAVFTRRKDEFSGFILLTDSTFYRWDPTTLAFVSVALPAGVTVDPDPKPTLKVMKENVYIVGYATTNLRYDPTDHALYKWGWEAAPSAPGVAAQAGGDLLTNATYKYAYAYFDLYTGEETTLSEATSAATTTSSKTIRVTVAAYTGDRHFNDLAAATDSDVGVVIYRTPADDPGTYYFVTTLNPGTLTYDDAGPETGIDTSLRPFEGTMQDEPRFSSLEEFQGRFFALSMKSNSNRMYHSSIASALFLERWEVRAYTDLPVTEGNTLTALGKTDTTLITHSRKGGFRNEVIETGLAPQIIPRELPWEAGAVGPKARATRNGWEYWLSERGPYRWREGLLAPQWIGKPIAPLFIDPTSGLCKLSDAARDKSELAYEWFSNTMRFFFPIGGATRPNQHWAYWLDAEKIPTLGGNGDPESGWFAQSPLAQCADLSHSLEKLDQNGKPVSPADRLERLVFADADGYVYEYDLAHKRGGLREGMLAKGFVASGSTTTAIEVNGGLFTGGDGLKGLRFETVSADGTTMESQYIASNDDNTITLVDALTTAPASGDIYYVGGIPAFWKSYPDHRGDPQAHKSLLHLYVGFQKEGPIPATSPPDWRLDVSIGAGRFPQSFKRTRTAKLSQWRQKMLANLTGIYFVYEVRNFRPDETFALTNLQPEMEYVGEKRRAVSE